MKVIGIDIDKIKAIFFILEENAAHDIIIHRGDFNYLTLTDDTDCEVIRKYQSAVHKFFDKINPDKIAILKRQTRGRFRAAPLSFKIEGLLQCYRKVDIEFVQPMSVSGYFKKHDFTLDLDFAYEEDAAKLACYLLQKTE